MDQANGTSIAPSSTSKGDALLILEQMLRHGGEPAVSPKIKFLAMLAIYKPAGLSQHDVEQLAEAMIDWGRRRFTTDNNPSWK